MDLSPRLTIAYHCMGEERRISRATSLLIISCFILKSKSILENLQELFLRRNLCKILGDAVVWNDGMEKVSNGLDDVSRDGSSRRFRF